MYSSDFRFVILNITSKNNRSITSISDGFGGQSSQVSGLNHLLVWLRPLPALSNAG